MTVPALPGSSNKRKGELSARLLDREPSSKPGPEWAANPVDVVSARPKRGQPAPDVLRNGNNATVRRHTLTLLVVAGVLALPACGGGSAETVTSGEAKAVDADRLQPLGLHRAQGLEAAPRSRRAPS